MNNFEETTDKYWKIGKKYFIFAKKAVVQFYQKVMPSALAFLSQVEILKWTEELTKSAATVYDKALDAKYILTREGGGNHRMFDGGHDLLGAWEKAKDALGDDTFSQEVIGYVSALWKDVTTEKGLPFFTWSKDSYEKTAEWVSNTVPGATKDWFYDLNSFDVMELASSCIGLVGAVFFLSKGDREKLSELLGSMGIVSIFGANPIMGISVVCITAYSYRVKKQKIDTNKLAKGAGLAGLSMFLFSILGMPILIEFVVVIYLTHLIRKHILDHNTLFEFITRKLKGIRLPEFLRNRLSFGSRT